MKFKMFTGAFVLLLMLAASGMAQQDPFDLGNQDSAYFVISEPVVGAVDQTVTAQLFFYHDAQDLSNVAFGFGWDNPNAQMVSVEWSPLATTGFMSTLPYIRNNIDSTNANQLFQCVGIALFNSGLPAAEDAQWVVTYTFQISEWADGDQFCINTADFSTNTFVDFSNHEYPPLYDGPYCVGSVVSGVLNADPTTIELTGVAGGANPTPLSSTITNTAGDPIYYQAATASSWVNLVSIDGTTPSPLWIGANISGLAAGDYLDSVHVTSEAATNDIWVYVNLHLDAANQAPVLDPIGDQGGAENSLIEFTVTASDPDGGFPSLTHTTLPGTASFTDHGDGTGTFSWMTTYDDAGDYPVTFTASDGDLVDDELITISVTNVNRDPVLDPIADVMEMEGVNINFVVSASDPDMENLIFRSSSLPGTATFTYVDDTSAEFDWTPGNTDAGTYPITFTVEDPSGGSDEQAMIITVLDADGFVLDPNPLVFAAGLGGANPADQMFNVTVSDGSMIAFAATTDATWFTATAAGATTPSSVTVSVDITGLAAGLYRDSVMIAGGELDPVYEYVELTIGNNLVVDPTEIFWTVSEGDLIPAETAIDVTEMGGDAIGYTATCDADWLTFGVGTESGTTPGMIMAGGFASQAPGPGTYNTTIVVTGDAVNSPIMIPVEMTVTPCPTLTQATVVYDHMAFAGETVMFDEIIPLTSSGPGEISWETSGSMAYTFDPTTGMTPGDLGVHYEMMFGAEGVYADTAYVSSVYNPANSCSSELMIITNVTVNRPPSADTIIVVNTPAVPGMRVGVPVIFTNSCRLTGLGLSLNWTDGMYLDSVSFAGSVAEYVANKVVAVDNDMMQVTITADVADQMLVPIGSEQLLATLFFALPCEIEEGTYGFSLGASPPLQPADVYFDRDCGEGVGTEFPEYIPGSIVVGTASNFVCGYVVDPFDNEIEGATVQLFEDYPFTMPISSTTSSGIGSFAFDEIMVIPFDLYAYKDGYYPGKVEDINFGELGVKIVLEPIPEILTPTSEWVDYYCPEASNTFLGAPVPVGAVVEAFTPQGLLVGQKMVTTAGQYGFMPVYRGNETFGEAGAMTGDNIRFTINGMDALTTGSTMYPDEFMQMEVCLEVRGTVEKVCTLFEGWNLISWNVNTETDDILTILDPIMENVDVVLGFEQGGLTFDPDLLAFSTLADVDHYSGYWVRIEGAAEVQLTVSGLPVAATTPIALTAGWNLVSYLPETAWATETALMTIDGLVEFAYGFPSGEIQVWAPGSTFNQLDVFAPCGGYWIKTTADAWLIYDDTDPVAVPRPSRQEVALGSRIAQTNWVNLYSENLTVDDQVVTTGATVTAHSVKNDEIVGTFTMKVDGQFGFMPVYAGVSGENGLQMGEEFYLAVNEVKTDEVFTWSNNGDRIEVTELSTAGSIGEVLPNGYSLTQNYPNPFNPSTRISFNMPVNGHAKVEIFNVLGRSTAVIFDGQAEAGLNTVVWDGRDANGNSTASGVYFYRLTSDKYTETRKMMLLK